MKWSYYQFRVGAEWIDPEEAEFLAQSGKGAHYLKGKGIIKVNEEQYHAMSRWNVSSGFEKGIDGPVTCCTLYGLIRELN